MHTHWYRVHLTLNSRANTLHFLWPNSSTECSVDTVREMMLALQDPLQKQQNGLCRVVCCRCCYPLVLVNAYPIRENHPSTPCRLHSFATCNDAKEDRPPTAKRTTQTSLGKHNWTDFRKAIGIKRREQPSA
eukprot:scpid94295/ scgid28203/ 